MIMNTVFRSTMALGIFALALAACGKGAESPSGECLAYSCDEDGAEKMLWATVDETYEQTTEGGKAALKKVIENGVSRMKKDQGFTPETFELAKGNLKKFLAEVPERGEDPLAISSEELAKGESKLCPLWPFC
jgi:hypothetical protein